MQRVDSRRHRFRQRHLGERRYHEHGETEHESEPLRLFYYEILLRSNKARAYLDFRDSSRNTALEADITSSVTPEEPLTQVKIYNDGTADYIRYSINEGTGSAPAIKLKFGESVEIPFVEVERHKSINTITVQATTSNATVRIIGII